MAFRRQVNTLIGCITNMALGISLISSRRTMFWVIILLNVCLETSRGQSDCTDTAYCLPNLNTDLLDDTFPDYRSLDVNNETCGFSGREIYQTIDSGDITEYYCDLSNDSIAYPEGFMYDSSTITGPTGGTKRVANSGTYWLSTRSVLNDGEFPGEISIVLNLTDKFLISSISVTFISPNTVSQSDGRPDAIAFELYDGANWWPMRLYAESCSSTFPDVVVAPAQFDGSQFSTSTYCQQVQYGGDVNTQGAGNVNHVTFEPAKDWQQQFLNDYDTQRFYITSAIRVRLVRPASLLSLRSYYAIADLTVNGNCACFGHASVCIGPNAAQCLCAHKTMGDNCEQCLPLYNNKTWVMGNPTSPNVCEACECNAHAQSCAYVVVKGYGVCENCEENTRGDFCEQCDPSYYRNPSNQNPRLNLTGLNIGECQGFNGTDIITYNCSRWCIPCDCNMNGTDPSVGSVCDGTGQCVCKDNVMGRRCDQCKDTYWNLDPDNAAAGCTQCDCDPVGTLNSVNLCNKTTGACLCKTNIEGQRCESCKYGSFDLNIANPDGCTLCDCDLGGSDRDSCYPTTGACTCRGNIGGRACREPFNGFYVPLLDYYTLEAEFNQQSLGTVVERRGHGEAGATFTGTGFMMYPQRSEISFLVNVDSTQQYDLILRYETSSMWPIVAVSVTKEMGSAYQCGGVDYLTGQTFTSDVNIPSALSAGFVTALQVCLLANEQFRVTVAIGSPEPFNSNAQLLLDSIVLLPNYTSTSAYSRADLTTQTTMATCYEAVKAVNQTRRDELGCGAVEYVIMAELLNGATQCLCNSSGTDGNQQCNPIGGQCPCKPGVMLQDCSRCMVDHYDIDLQDGCLPCLCDPNGSSQTSCNETGVCSCKTNVEGTKCDVCIQDHYGLYTGSGCVPCVCNPEYSVNNTCDDTGQCICKPGVSGLQCDTCADGFYNLTTDGCTPCQCNTNGSNAQTTCDNRDGTCQCRSRVQGNSCDQCKPGYYGLGPWNAAGCLTCVCSGHSTNCTSALGWYETVTASIWALTNPSAVDDRWQGEDESGRGVAIDDPTIFFTGLQVAQFVMRLINDPMYLDREVLYFIAPEKYIGDKRSSYGRELSFSLSLSSPENLLTDTWGDVALKGMHADYTLVTKLTAVPGTGKTDYTLILREENWKVNRTDGQTATFEQMMEVLSFLESLKIRGKFSNMTNAEVDLYAASLLYSSQDNSSGIEINNVEDCFCPPGYDGQFCELCAPGYRRADVMSGPFGECVACQCNDHGVGDCDIDTGTCTCTHNTTGLQCDQCLPGFYGDATKGTPNDCFPCLCPGNVVASAVNIFATTCEPVGTGAAHRCIDCAVGHTGDHCEECITDYYGVPEDPANNEGRCVPCVCNGRADTCNSTTGDCIDCRNNTSGQECHICAPRYFGDAMNYDCKECNCSLGGATGECDHNTGQCVCHPNVFGANCSQCVARAFGYDDGDPGCTMCDCDLDGSYNPITGDRDLSCNLTTGQCTCRLHVIGRQCNMCEDTYFDVNMLSGCQECGCDLGGSANITGQTFGTCDLLTGQCGCAKPAIIGRTCNECSKASTKSYTFVEGIYVGSFPECELCGECYDNWATEIDIVGFALEDLNLQVLDIWAHYDNALSETVAPQLELMRADITDAQDAINSAKYLMEKLNNLKAGFSEVVAQVANLTQMTDDLDLLRIRSEAELSSLRYFDGSVITVEGITKTLTDIAVEINAEVTRQRAQYSIGNSTNYNLQTISSTVTEFETRITEFRERVRVALDQLTIAESNRLVAENYMSGSFLSNYQGNTESLANQRAALSELEVIRGDADANVSSAESQISIANTTVTAAHSVANQKQDDMITKLELSQTAKLNATEAQRNVGMAYSAVNTYMSKAESTKAAVTRAVENIAEGVQLTTRADANVQEVERLVQAVEAVALRPLADLQTITAAIRGTQVSEADVAAANQNATNALNIANQAQRVAEEAITKSHQALEDVRAIQHNLEQSGLVRTDTQTIIQTADSAYNQINSTVHQVGNKALSAQQRALDTQSSASSLSAFIVSVKTCLATAKSDSETAKQVGEEASALASSAAEQHTLNAELVQNISKTLDVLKTQPGYTEAAETSQAMESLVRQLEVAQDGTNLQAMINDLSAQTGKMTDLENEINLLEGTLGAILANLENLTPETADCAAN